MTRHSASKKAGPARRGDPIELHIGRKIRSLRRERGLSAGELDRTAGIGAGSVEKYERGAGRLSSSTLLRLAQALNVTVSTFYDGLPETFIGNGKPEVQVHEADSRKLLSAISGLPTPQLRISVLALIRSLAASSASPLPAIPPPAMTGPGAFETIVKAFGNCGLICRGAFHPGPRDGLPRRVGTLVLIGNAGPALWDAFSRERRDEPEPMDNWTRRKVYEIAIELGANVLFPFDGPPYLPFQKWALACDTVYPSPVGTLIHPVYGLWHAYRAALLFKDKIALPSPPESPARNDEKSPCATCADKPCLSTCPVSAFSPDTYDVPACAAHLGSPAGGPCRTDGCLARRACPVGRAYTYGPQQMGFHMDSFLRSRKQ